VIHLSAERQIRWVNLLQSMHGWLHLVQW